MDKNAATCHNLATLQPIEKTLWTGRQGVSKEVAASMPGFTHRLAAEIDHEKTKSGRDFRIGRIAICGSSSIYGKVDMEKRFHDRIYKMNKMGCIALARGAAFVSVGGFRLNPETLAIPVFLRVPVPRGAVVYITGL